MPRYVSAEGAEACRFFPILLGVHTGHILCYVIPMLRLLGMGRGRGGASEGSKVCLAMRAAKVGRQLGLV